MRDSINLNDDPPSNLSAGWVAIAAFIFLTVVAISAHVGASFRLVYVLGSLGVGGLLYLRYPILYLGFVWWMWFLTPLLTRIVDYQSSFDELRLMQVAPFLVTLLTGYTFVKEMPRSLKYGGLPFILAIVGVIYGGFVGFIQTSPVSVARGMLDWFTPVIWGFYIFSQWRNYPEYRRAIQQIFLWGVIAIGSYGIYQYLVAPDWDKYWLISTKLTSMGQPKPLGIRVWSTMAAPAPFAMTMMAGLLMLFGSKGILRIPAAGAGYLAFLLSLVRSVWLAWAIGFGVLLLSLKPKFQLRLMGIILVMALCVLPLTNVEPFASTIQSRLQSFTSLDSDRSAIARQDIYQRDLIQASTNILGNGVGNTFVVRDGQIQKVVIDSGFLDLFFTLGWFGGMFYIGGLLLLLKMMFQSSTVSSDPFLAVSRSVSVGCIAIFPSDTPMLAAGGMLLWGFIGISIAAQVYERDNSHPSNH
jgi:hypothetical protein